MIKYNMIADRDCMRTCIASILELAPIAIPDFMDKNPDDPWPHVQRWLASQGLIAWFTPFDGSASLEQVLGSINNINPGVYYLIGGRGAYEDHMVVALGDKIVHDPSRLSPGLTGPASNGFWLVVTLVTATLRDHAPS